MGSTTTQRRSNLKKFYGVGLKVGTLIKVIGWSTYPLPNQPSKAIMEIQMEFDRFHRENVRNAAAFGVTMRQLPPAQICYFSAEGATQYWVGVKDVEIDRVYHNVVDAKQPELLAA
jgi:hypothetical protein